MVIKPVRCVQIVKEEKAVVKPCRSRRGRVSPVAAAASLAAAAAAPLAAAPAASLAATTAASLAATATASLAAIIYKRTL